MRSFAVIPFLAGAVHALPQAASSCTTVTTELIIPTTTYTFLSTYVTTSEATGAEDLGTYTSIVNIKSTQTIDTVTSTETACTASGTITSFPVSTVYTTSGAVTASPTSFSNSSAPTSPPKHYKRALGLYPRQDPAEPCTTTSYTFTTTYGATYTYLPASETSTYTDYTAFTLATVTSTSYGGTTYVLATATATTSGVCGPTVNATTPATSTTTQDARCAPSALVSSSNGFGLEYADYVIFGGATYTTTAADGSQCCQLCADTPNCAASTWDIRTDVCTLAFPVDSSSGAPSCDEPLLAYYDAGPDSPMAPGTGLYVGTLCGQAEYGQAPPDDGT